MPAGPALTLVDLPQLPAVRTSGTWEETLAFYFPQEFETDAIGCVHLKGVLGTLYTQLLTL